jgi:tetratricopeptide (TPR) repeat protein
MADPIRRRGDGSMSKRARIAQLEANGEARPITESEQRAIRARARGDARRTTLDRGFSIDELLKTEERAVGEIDVGALIAPSPERSAPRRKRAESVPEPQAAPEPHVERSGPRAKRATKPPVGESVWDAVEDRYKTEGHWSDLLEMYLQRVDGTRDLAVKGSLFFRMGQVLRDELHDPQQALDAFVESFLLDPRNVETLKAVEDTARENRWWNEILATMKREIPNVKNDKRVVAICEHAMRWAETELNAPEKAEPFLDQIRRLDPGHPVVQQHLAVTYGENAAYDSQRESYERALMRARGDDERRTLHLLLGQLNEERFRDYVQAGKHYEIALELDGRSTKALQGLERVCRLEERFADLALVLERQAAVAGDDEARVEILVRLADLHERHFASPTQASPILEEAVRINPRHPTALSALERCYHSLRAWPEMVAALEIRVGVVEATPEKTAVLTQIALLLELEMGDLEGATQSWQRVLNYDPSNVRGLAELARSCERANDWPAAAAYKAKLAELAPSPEESAKIHVAIGDMLSADERDPKLAHSHYERAASIHPNTTEAWEGLEREARRSGDGKRTALFLEKRAASTEAPRHKAELFVELARLHESQGDAAVAELAFERAIKADPTNETAAEAVLDIQVRAERWADAQPVCDVLLAATSVDTNPDRAFALLRLATRISFELGQRERAFLSALAAYRTQPSLESAEDVVVSGHDVRDDAALLAQGASELGAIVATPLELGAPILAKLARIRLAQGAENDAATLFSRALAHDGELPEALEGLAEILVNREDWERACAYKRKLAHLLTDPEQHFALLVETGDLWAKHAQNMPMAALAYEEALAMRPRDPGLLHTLLWLYGELACWEKLVETLRALADLHADPLAKAKSVYAMAMVVRDHLSDLPAAGVLLEEVLDLDATRLDAFERVVRVHTEMRDWEELKHAYGRMLRRLKTSGNVELRHALFFQLGLIYRDRLGDNARALDAFKAAQRLKPDDAEVRKAIVELFVLTEDLDAGIAMVREAVVKRPLDAGLYAELYDLFLRQRSFDRAWCAVDALVALGAPLDEQKTRFYTDYPPHVLSDVPGTLAATAWRSHIVHRDLDPALTAIYAIMTPVFLRARIAIVPFTQLRSTMEDSLREDGGVAQDVLESVGDACEILNCPTPSLHARKEQSVPLALAPAKNALFVSLAACEALPSDSLAFVVGKRLAETRAELTARAACPSVTELRGLLRIAMQLAEATTATPTTGDPTFDRALAQAITREERSNLRAAVAAAKAQGTDFDIIRWSSLADASAARVGLLLSGRINAAKHGMTVEPQMPGDLSAREKLSQLLVFAMSDEYFDLRQAIGMGVDASEAA